MLVTTPPQCEHLPALFNVMTSGLSSAATASSDDGSEPLALLVVELLVLRRELIDDRVEQPHELLAHVDGDVTVAAQLQEVTR
jgi:hypothetical protein